jgi:hypothetical protein
MRDTKTSNKLVTFSGDKKESTELKSTTKTNSSKGGANKAIKAISSLFGSEVKEGVVNSKKAN